MAICACVLGGPAMLPAALEVTESCPLWNLVCVVCECVQGSLCTGVCMWVSAAFPVESWMQLAVCE